MWALPDAFGAAYDLGYVCPEEVAFAGQGRDAGTGWYRLRARPYDPKVGRFVSPDPSGYAGGDNLYAYARNNPVRWVDLSGLDPTDPATGRPAEEEASGARMISLRVRQIEAGMRQAPTTFEHRTTFERAYPELADEVEDVHHAVPQVVQNRYPGRFTRAEMHSLANLRGIPVGRSQLHEELKLRWNRFYRGNPNATRQQILWRAAQMDIEYGHRFLPRLDPPPR